MNDAPLIGVGSLRFFGEDSNDRSPLDLTGDGGGGKDRFEGGPDARGGTCRSMVNVSASEQTLNQRVALVSVAACVTNRSRELTDQIRCE